MNIDLNTISLVDFNYKKKDPRVLPYFYPKSLNIVSYSKKMQDFSFYQALDVAEQIAKKSGFLLIPWSCIHWKRAKRLGNDRKIKIGRHSFFLLKENEMTKNEKMKLIDYVKDMKERMKSE